MQEGLYAPSLLAWLLASDKSSKPATALNRTVKINMTFF